LQLLRTAASSAWSVRTRGRLPRRNQKPLLGGQSRCVKETSFRAIQFQRMELLSSYDSISTERLDFVLVFLLFYPFISLPPILLFRSGPSSVFNFISVRGLTVLSIAFTTARMAVRDPGQGSGENILLCCLHRFLFYKT
jgi:hypothetical protein